MLCCQRLTAAGQSIDRPFNLIAIIWTGATSAGNTVILKEVGGDYVWEGRASGAHTYIGVTLPEDGVRLRNGLEVESIDAGSVYLYFQED
jgi:hypothetical protein